MPFDDMFESMAEAMAEAIYKLRVEHYGKDRYHKMLAADHGLTLCDTDGRVSLCEVGGITIYEEETMPTPMKTYKEIARRCGVNVSDEKNVDVFYEETLPDMSEIVRVTIMELLLSGRAPEDFTSEMWRILEVAHGVHGKEAKQELIDDFQADRVFTTP